MITLFSGLSIIVILCVLTLGVLVLLSGVKQKSNRLFFLFVISVIFWLFTNFLLGIIEDPKYTLIALRLTFLTAVLMIYFLFIFSLEFPKKLIKKTGILSLIALAPTLLIMLMSISNLLVTGFTRREVLVLAEYGQGFPFFFVYILAFLIAIFAILHYQYKTSSGILRQQARFLFLGVILSALFITTTDLLVPLLFESNLLANFGQFGIVFLLVFTAYAITKHRLLNIRVIATELFTALIILVFLIQTLLAPNITQLLLRGGMLILVIFFGALLIRSVLQEVKRREQIQVLAQKLEEANKQLKRLDEAKTNFMNIAAHQLRTPISGIKGYLSMLLEGDYGELQDQQKKVMENNLKAADRMINLVDVFLDVSKIEVGRLKLTKEEVQPEDLIFGVIEQLSNLAKKKGLFLKFIRPRKRLSKLLVDPDKIHNVIINLTDNAIKYTEKGGITVLAEEKDNKVYVHVKDTGIGIPKKEVSTLFQKFSRGRRAVINPSGSGLGLFIVKQLVEAHGGKAWVESEGEGKGSTFSFSLPTTKVKKGGTNE